MAVNAIFEEIGSIKKIAPIFQTPAMGFEGDDFLNCVIQVESNQSADLVLDTIFSIETELGRVRDEKAGFSSRPIDIDILFYDDEIINTKNLIIPHPEIQNRKFVLAPLAVISQDFIHPKLNKTISELLEETNDSDEVIKYSKWLRNPILDFDMSKFRYVAIEGNIGAGKTSLAAQLASDFNAKLVLERFKENPFLPQFYKDPDRFAFPLEMSFLADRYQQLLDDLTQYDLFKENVIGDYDANKSLIFASSGGIFSLRRGSKYGAHSHKTTISYSEFIVLNRELFASSNIPALSSKSALSLALLIKTTFLLMVLENSSDAVGICTTLA